MKRLLVCGLGLGVVLAGSAARAASPAPDAAGEVLVRWQFAGTAALAANTNAAALRTVLGLPTTRTLLDQVHARLAAAPETRPLAPFLADLLASPSLVEARGEAWSPDWTFAVLLPPERAAVWTRDWPAAVQAWKRPAARVAEARGWVVAGLGKAGLPGFEAVLQQIQRTGKPSTAAEPGAWLEVEANLARLAPPLGLPPNVTWPTARASWLGRGTQLRLNGRLQYPAPLELPLEPWRIPTNTIRDPLISFTAVQGVRPWLASQGLLAELGAPAPNQVFGWSQSLVPYLTQYAWEMPEAGARLRTLPAKIEPALRSRLPWLDFGEVRFITNFSRLVWTGFPILVPFASPASDPGFVTAGIFPLENPGEPAPAELYAQFRGRTNLVLYDWEVTPVRLQDWGVLDNLRRMILGLTPPPTNTAALLWLQDTNVTRHFGNAVTEITRTGPRELAVVRNSALGLTAFELRWVAAWLSGERFPRLSPPDSILKRRAERPAATPAVR